MMTYNIDQHQRAELAETFGLLSDPTRLAIVLACLDQRNSAGEIARKLKCSPSLVSHHLRLLRAARMLRSERKGKQVFYEMSDTCVYDVLNIMINHLFVHDSSHREGVKIGEVQ
tara:strand:- start:39 stop:380 length:342 start_codon:yes stop_codon:yes gene_type:complete